MSAPDSDTPHGTHDALMGITEADSVVKFVVKMASRPDNVVYSIGYNCWVQLCVCKETYIQIADVGQLSQRDGSYVKKNEVR